MLNADAISLPLTASAAARSVRSVTADTLRATATRPRSQKVRVFRVFFEDLSDQLQQAVRTLQDRVHVGPVQRAGAFVPLGVREEPGEGITLPGGECWIRHETSAYRVGQSRTDPASVTMS